MESRVRVELLGGFKVSCDGQETRFSLGAQRLLSFLALQEGGAHRATAGEQLWPDSPRGRSAANLRSALWQSRRLHDLTAICCVGPRLHLSPNVRVDLHDMLPAARRITEDDDIGAGDGPPNYEELISVLSKGLLPDWLDEWLTLDRERWDQVRLHTLETLAQHLMLAEKYLPALEAALAAVAIEPVRESAHRTVVEVYIAEGNSACALKHYQRYRGLVHRELGVTPSNRMTRLIQPLAHL